MSTYGITYGFGLDESQAGDERLMDKLDVVHDSISSNPVFESVDIICDDITQFSILIAVTVPDGMDAQSFVAGVAGDAMERAFKDADLGEFSMPSESSASERVLQMA